ncbi:unnamed protein product [Onchocerca flexuosa]|uniref:Ovate family protein n=1 Tax=Onchocerca flexuosa TaxID=387005 RepID=A0A183I062_9BILA|nr:unnamed protein product [Onchocerca flexuosa]
MPRPRKNFGTPRAMTFVKSNHFDSPFRSPYASPIFPHNTTMSSPYSRHSSLYQHQKRPYCHMSTPTYSVNSLTSGQYSPNWRGPSKAYSPYIYKNPQNMVDVSYLIQEYSGFSSTIPPDNRRDSRMNSGANEQFNVNEYVIPSMTANPWAKLEEFFVNCRLDEQ